jgi:hypothetical protein
MMTPKGHLVFSISPIQRIGHICQKISTPSVLNNLEFFLQILHDLSTWERNVINSRIRDDGGKKGISALFVTSKLEFPILQFSNLKCCKMPLKSKKEA